MRLSLESIPPRGDRLVLDDQARWAVEAAKEALEGPVVSIAGDLLVLMRGDVAEVEGELSVAVERECDRCGAQLHLRIEGPVDLVYRPVSDDVEIGRELSSGDMDLGFYRDSSLDLSEVVRDHLVLLLPLQVLCTDPLVETIDEGCTENFLEKISTPVPDSRFAILDSLKLET